MDRLPSHATVWIANLESQRWLTSELRKRDVTVRETQMDPPSWHQGDYLYVLDSYEWPGDALTAHVQHCQSRGIKPFVVLTASPDHDAQSRDSMFARHPYLKALLAYSALRQAARTSDQSFIDSVVDAVLGGEVFVSDGFSDLQALEPAGMVAERRITDPKVT